MVIGFRERDAQKSNDNLHNKRVDRTLAVATPFALATLSTVAAANNSSFDPLSLISDRPVGIFPHALPTCLPGSRLNASQE